MNQNDRVGSHENVPNVIVRRETCIEAPEITTTSDTLAMVDACLIAIGMEPQLTQSRLLLLLGLARYAGAACSVALIGPSGVGKTTVATTVSRLMPSEDLVYLVDASYAAVSRGFGWDVTTNGRGTYQIDLRDKLIILDENVDMRAADRRITATLRQATSADVTNRSIRERGEWVQYQLLGPTTLLDCRLDSAALEYQDANRMVPIALNDDPATLEAISRLAAEKATHASRKRKQQREAVSHAWRRFLRGLDSSLSVAIDYAGQLRFDTSKHASGRITHAPRLLTAVHAAISSVAWLRQGLKVCHQDDQGSYIYATREDYRIAHRALLEANILDERPSIPARSLDVLGKWQREAEVNGNQPLSAPDLYRRIGVHVDRGNMTRHLSPLLEMELVADMGRNNNKQKMYQLTSIGLSQSSAGLLTTLPKPNAITITAEDELNRMAERL